MRAPLLIALLTVSLGSGACGGNSEEAPPPATPKLPAAQIVKIERTLKTAAAGSGQPPFRTLDCPSDVPAKVNAAFTCAASSSRGKGSVRATLYNKQGTDVGYEANVGGVKVSGRQDVK